jgi:hypothetical protein
MSKKVRFCVLLSISLFFLFGCKNNTDPPAKTLDVYVAGFTVKDTTDSQRAVCWKNGQKVELSSTLSKASGIVASGSDVYVSGFDKNGGDNEHACYWKNGTQTILSTSATDSEGMCIAVSGSDVYVGGKDYIKVSGSSIDQARYWKNSSSNEVVLSQSVPSDDTIVNDILLDGTDALCAGYEYKDSHPLATRWKNNVETFISDYESTVNAIAISGSDTYYGGWMVNVTNNATVWKEDNSGNVSVFSTLSTKDSNVNDMVFSGEDLYVLVSDTEGEGETEHQVGKVWKNGTLLWTLSNGNDSLECSSIAINGTDVYVVGYDVANSTPVTVSAVLYKNGVRTVLESDTDYAYAMDIAFVEK